MLHGRLESGLEGLLERLLDLLVLWVGEGVGGERLSTSHHLGVVAELVLVAHFRGEQVLRGESVKIR